MPEVNSYEGCRTKTFSMMRRMLFTPQFILLCTVVVLLACTIILQVFGHFLVSNIYEGNAWIFNYLIGGQDTHPLVDYQQRIDRIISSLWWIALPSSIVALVLFYIMFSKQADKKNTQILLVAGAITLFLAEGILLFSSAGRDDVHITYWAAETLVQTGTILNLNMEFVEQSTSLLHVVLLSILHILFSPSLPTLGALFSMVAGMLVIVATWRLSDLLGGKPSVSAPLILALATYFIYWSLAGLETTLVALLVILVIHFTYLFLINSTPKAFLYSILTAGLYIVVRPESIFVLLTFYCAIAAYVFFRRNYYGVGLEYSQSLGRRVLLLIVTG